MKKIIFVTSGKGGTGKSVFTLNIGATFALGGHKTLLIDMNTGMRTLDLLIGAENKAHYDFGDVVRGVCGIKEAAVKCDTVPNLDVVVSAQTAGEFYTEATIKKVIDTVKDEYEYVILDGAPGIDRRTDICAAVAHETIIVLTPDYASIRAAEAVDARLIKNKVVKRKCVVNRVSIDLSENEIEPKVTDIAQRIGASMIGMILEDENLRVSSSMGIPMVLKRDSYLAENFAKIARGLM